MDTYVEKEQCKDKNDEKVIDLELFNECTYKCAFCDQIIDSRVRLSIYLFLFQPYLCTLS